MRRYHTAYFSLIIFCLTISLSAADDAPLPAVKLAMTPLDLSQPLTAADMMAAGQLGGPLHPTFDLPDIRPAQLRALSFSPSAISTFVRRDAMLREFGAAMNLWNAHEYRLAAEKLARYEEAYPDSPWRSEAMLHRGCEAFFTGRYREADDLFQRIMHENAGQTHIGAKLLLNKARSRLAVLRVTQNSLDEARALFGQLLEESPDWRDRTYASGWIQRLSLMQTDRLALLTCGSQALAAIAERDGRADDARRLRELRTDDRRGFSLATLRDLAVSIGYNVAGRRLTAAELAAIPLPAIAPVTSGGTSDRGHYWIIEQADARQVRLFDAQSGARFTQTPKQFAQEWDGAALIITRPSPSQAKTRALPGVAMSGEELGQVFGGCCGVKRPLTDIGDPERNAGPQANPSSSPCGSPTWRINMVNMNLFMRGMT